MIHYFNYLRCQQFWHPFVAIFSENYFQFSCDLRFPELYCS